MKIHVVIKHIYGSNGEDDITTAICAYPRLATAAKRCRQENAAIMATYTMFSKQDTWWECSEIELLNV